MLSLIHAGKWGMYYFIIYFRNCHDHLSCLVRETLLFFQDAFTPLLVMPSIIQQSICRIKTGQIPKKGIKKKEEMKQISSGYHEICEAVSIGKGEERQQILNPKMH